MAFKDLEFLIAKVDSGFQKFPTICKCWIRTWYLFCRTLNENLEILNFHLQRLVLVWKTLGLQVNGFHLERLDLSCKCYLDFGKVSCDVKNFEFICEGWYFICKTWMTFGYVRIHLE
jgi:hypothetical protein